MLEEKIRKLLISKKLALLTALLQKDNTLSFANIFCTILRPSNISDGGNKDPFFMTDIDFLAALEKTIKELEED